jgi:hypothetical protein
MNWILKATYTISVNCLRIMEDPPLEQTVLIMGSFKAHNCILLFTAKFMRTVIGGKNE